MNPRTINGLYLCGYYKGGFSVWATELCFSIAFTVTVEIIAVTTRDRFSIVPKTNSSSRNHTIYAEISHAGFLGNRAARSRLDVKFRSGSPVIKRSVLPSAIEIRRTGPQLLCALVDDDDVFTPQ